MSRDPIGYEGSKWNILEYVSSLPTNSSDPLGLTGPGCYGAGAVYWHLRPKSPTCTVFLYDGDDKIGDNFKCGALHEAKGGGLAIDEGGKGIGAAIQTARDNGCCIRDLQIMDHGSPGRQMIGDSYVNDGDIIAICKEMCPGSSVKLWGCEAGGDLGSEKHNAAIPEAMSKDTEHNWLQRESTLAVARELYRHISSLPGSGAVVRRTMEDPTTGRTKKIVFVTDAEYSR